MSSGIKYWNLPEGFSDIELAKQIVNKKIILTNSEPVHFVVLILGILGVTWALKLSIGKVLIEQGFSIGNKIVYLFFVSLFYLIIIFFPLKEVLF